MCSEDLSALSSLEQLELTMPLTCDASGGSVSLWRTAGCFAATLLHRDALGSLAGLRSLSLHVLHGGDVHAFRPRGRRNHVPAAANAAMDALLAKATSWPLPACPQLCELSLRGLVLGMSQLCGGHRLVVRTVLHSFLHMSAI